MKAGLLKTLFKLKLKHSNNPSEDYLTEILAYVLENNKGLLKNFVQNLKIGILKNQEESMVKTQVVYSKLPTHNSDSVPDISIFSNELVIFIECKIGANEGYKQLSRYAEHLDNLTSNGVIVYLTRDFDPKDQSKILKNCVNGTKFKHIRWFEVFNFLKAQNKDLLISELLKFLKEMDLSSNNQFTPTDLLSLTNFSRVRRMMDETMYGEVSTRFKKLTGKISQHSSGMTQIRNHDRYVYYSTHKEGFQFLLGFWLNSFNEKEYPEVKVVIEVAPKSKNRKKIISGLKEISKSQKSSFWNSYSLDLPTEWAGIYSSKSIKEFLAHENHIEAIQKFFIKCLDETDKAKKVLEN